MKNRIIAVAACALCMLAAGSAPRCLEELRIVGGVGDSADGGNLRLSANWTASPGDTLELLCDVTYWNAVARSNN